MYIFFSPVNHCNSFENIILISDRDVPYQVKLTDLEDCMVPKVAHYNYEYMKSIGLFTFVNVITGTVTAINRFVEFKFVINFILKKKKNKMRFDSYLM